MKAIIIGATGLIGQNLLTLLESDNFYDEIEIWVRKPLKTSSSKVKVKIVDFDKITETASINANAVFCCVGTTIKKAKTQEAFRKVDFDIPVSIAKLCQDAKVEKFIVISSLGANKDSKNNYLRVKGEMETEISSLNIQTIKILRPALLMGKRDEFRPGELIGKFIMQMIGFVFVGKLRKYRGIKAITVAGAMQKIAKDHLKGIRIFESNEIEAVLK